jgi:hypothetical protein
VEDLDCLWYWMYDYEVNAKYFMDIGNIGAYIYIYLLNINLIYKWMIKLRI